MRCDDIYDIGFTAMRQICFYLSFFDECLEEIDIFVKYSIFRGLHFYFFGNCYGVTVMILFKQSLFSSDLCTRTNG